MTLSSLISRVEEGSELASASVRPEPMNDQLLRSRNYWLGEAERLREHLSNVSAELAWYGEQARLARLIHREGDAGRHALAADGGKRARSALENSPAGLADAISKETSHDA